MNFSEKKWNTIIFWIAGISLMSYSIIRAWKIPITVDEGTSFLTYVQYPLSDVFLNRPVNTNNHFLNTLLIKLTTAIFGDHQFSVRLSSLLGHFLYLFFSFKLLQSISRKHIVILAGIGLFHFNPYFNDFFGLARGYSLSWGLMMGSMYFFHQYILEEKNKMITWAFVFAGLSVYSILIAMNYFLALIIAFNFVFITRFLQKKELVNFWKYFFKKNIPAMMTSIVLVALLAYPIYHLRSRNEFYGAADGFYQDTMLTLVHHSLFGKKYFGTDFPHVLLGIAIAVFSIVFFKSLRDYLKKNFEKTIVGPLAFCILFLVVCWSTIAQFHLLGTPYLTDRTGLILIPLFSIIPVFFFNFFDKNKILQWAICLIPLVGYSYHFSKCANTFTVREWWFDTNNIDVLNYFLENLSADQAEENPQRKVTFAISGVNSPSFHFYEKVWKLEGRVDMVRKDQLQKNEFFDYYYIEENYFPQISIEHYDKVKKFDSRYLLRKKPTAPE